MDDKAASAGFPFVAMATDSFIVSRLTPAGRGAVACLAVEGPGAAAAVAEEVRLSCGRADTIRLDRPALGRFGPHGEEVIVVRRRDEQFEIHCHGGPAPIEYCIDRLAARGGRRIPWEQWATGRAATPVQAAALAALSRAPTERCAAILLDQYSGAFDRAVEHIEQLIDEAPAEALRLCDEISSRSNLGRHLVQPWRVALVGRPNVGKSSLLNALAGFSRAIVHSAPGTTRDLVALETSLDGWPIELCDTAGLRDAADAVEQAGIALAEAAAAKADVVVLVLDGTRPAAAVEEQLLRRRPDAVCTINKCDLPAAEQPPWVAKAKPISVSAQQSIGLDQLTAAIVQRFGPFPPPGAAVPFSEALRELPSPVGRGAGGEGFLSVGNIGGRGGGGGIQLAANRPHPNPLPEGEGTCVQDLSDGLSAACFEILDRLRLRAIRAAQARGIHIDGFDQRSGPP